MSMDFRAMLCFLRAGHWAETGLKTAPRDATLFLALGLAAETIGVTGYAESAPFATYDTRGRVQYLSMKSDPIDKTRQMNVAREAFEKALAIEPGQAEARLRLGRVLWRLGRVREAQEPLRQAAFAKEESIQYLARLFLGQCLEDAQNLDGAINEYKSALSLRPDTQIGAVALAHALFLRGDVDRAREILEPELAFSGRRKTLDPYWIYLIGTPEAAAALLDALRLKSVQ
jgi:tetratricopeptide (TPR) repeat protein